MIIKNISNSQIRVIPSYSNQTPLSCTHRDARPQRAGQRPASTRTPASPARFAEIRVGSPPTGT